jgi:ABC-type oligopeptide transport system substrate-binding subunit/class 3 adenylate cyclase
MKEKSSSEAPGLPGGTVTFLFTDIAGSTRLLHQLGDRYKVLLMDHHRLVRQVVSRRDGREVSTEGDAFFVSFARATEAVAAAAEIQRDLVAHSWPEGVEVKVRMGLHTGEPWILETDYAGVDVHRAARIAHAGHGGQVLLSETTTALVRDDLPEGVGLLGLGHYQLKDMRRPERIHQLTIAGLPREFPSLNAPAHTPVRTPMVETGRTLPAFLAEEEERPEPLFVGRERELVWLMERVKAVIKGEGGSPVLFVTGDPGSGKSALLQAVARKASVEGPELLVAFGACNAFSGAGEPYLPFRDALKIMTGDIEDGWRAGTLTNRQAHALWEALPDTARVLMEQGPGLLGSLLPGRVTLERLRTALPQNDPTLSELAARIEGDWSSKSELEQGQLFDQVTQTWRALAEKRPVLLILDDLQWVDKASVNLLFHLGRRLAGSRVVILGAYRPEEVSLGRDGERHPLEKLVAEFQRAFGQILLDLNLAAGAEGEAFVEALIDSEPNALGPAFRKALLAHTGGHPLFTVEILRNLQERGDLVRDDERRWVESPELSWEALPGRLEGVIAERIGRLEEELREILSVAAVEGEDFTAQVIARVQEIQERRLLRTLSQEVERRHQLIREKLALQLDRRVLARYRFAHTLFQRYLYNNISSVERQLLHGEIADILEELYASHTEDITVQLAWHYAEAGEEEKALPYLLKAGDSARALFAFDEAVPHYEQALEIYRNRGDFERASRMLMKLGLTHHGAFDYQRSSRAYEESFRLQQRISPWSSPMQLAPAQHPLRAAVEDVLTFDPGKEDEGNTARILGQLFSGLISLTPDMNIIPDVARRWEIFDDGLTYVFHLRDDVRWSDGESVTAQDFVLGWRRVLDPTNKSMTAPHIFYDVRGAQALHQGTSGDPDALGVRALDDWTLRIELERPSSHFLYLLACVATYPVPSHTIAAHGEAWTDLDKFVSNGPFRVESYRPGQLMVLKRNPTYHGNFQGNLEAVRLRVLTHLPEETGKLVPGYEKDEYDIVFLAKLPPAERQQTIQRHATDYVTSPSLSTHYVNFDVSRPPFDDPRVRRAFVLATDRQEIAAVSEMGFASAATGGFIPLGAPGHVPGLAIPHDLEEARRNLAEAGYPGGVGFPKVSALLFNQAARFTESLLSPWQDRLGVEISSEIVNWTTFMKSIHDKSSRPHIYTIAWEADYPDPDNYMRVAVKNSTEWRNETYDALVNQAKQIMDHEQRMGLYRQAEEILVREAPLFPFFYPRQHLLVKPWVRNYRPEVIGAPVWKDVIIEPH